MESGSDITVDVGIERDFRAAKSPDSGKQSEAQGSTAKGAGGRKAAGTDIGRALSGAYQETVSEAIPDDLMDLLNRLE
ncbi:MAG: NepR family anti-sigma factor [Sphingobium sp.]